MRWSTVDQDNSKRAYHELGPTCKGEGVEAVQRAQQIPAGVEQSRRVATLQESLCSRLFLCCIAAPDVFSRLNPPPPPCPRLTLEQTM